jgi:hypothetical protein
VFVGEAPPHAYEKKQLKYFWIRYNRETVIEKAI